jgi:hypothetical protein
MLDINSLKPEFPNGIISVNGDLLKLVFSFRNRAANPLLYIYRDNRLNAKQILGEYWFLLTHSFTERQQIK